MEKFAERYYLQNREVFASADMAFILAFSTIMLQTNLHNPAIKEDKRMTKEQFLKQNKGISADGELPEDLLCEIYDRIAAGTLSCTTTCCCAVRGLCSSLAKHIVYSCCVAVNCYVSLCCPNVVSLVSKAGCSLCRVVWYF
jgi:hypothetical protein